MPDGKPPALSPQDEAELDILLANPLFQAHADTFMDMEFAGTGLSDDRPDLEVDEAYLYQVKLALHSAAIARVEPGEPAVAAYRIAREQIADEWQQLVLKQLLTHRYRAALADENFSVASTIWNTLATIKLGAHRRQFAKARQAVS